MLICLFISLGQFVLGLCCESTPVPDPVGRGNRTPVCRKRTVHPDVKMRKGNCCQICDFDYTPHATDALSLGLPLTSARKQNNPKDQACALLQDSCMQGEC